MPELSVKSIWERYKGQYITTEQIATDCNVSFDQASHFLSFAAIQTPTIVLLMVPGRWWVIDTGFHKDYFNGKGWMGKK